MHTFNCLKILHKSKFFENDDLEIFKHLRSKSLIAIINELKLMGTFVIIPYKPILVTDYDILLRQDKNMNVHIMMFLNKQFIIYNSEHTTINLPFSVKHNMLNIKYIIRKKEIN